ncbi:MAG TPA: glycosyltransferase family 4 protein [Mycobacteriales bacterium]|nr:glycosyltransferase family 4 protein [Mycobacteriales bacterium]
MTASRPAVLAIGMGELADQPGGLNRYVAETGRALRRQGWAVRTVTVPPSAPLAARLVSAARVAARSAAATDVVAVHFALYAWWPVVAGALRRHPLVAHVHGPWADEGDDRASARRLKRAVERAVYRRALRVVVLSDAVRDVVVAGYGVDPARVLVLPPGVDRDRFAPGPVDRAALGLPGDVPVVLAVRRLVPRMGLPVLVDALADVPGAHLAVVGDGPERAALEQRAARRGVAARTTFAGRVADDDLVRWYRAADVTVVPSVAHEGWGLVVDESLATGTPVVASRHGGLPAALAGLGGAGLVPPGDPAALAARLREALDGTRPLPATEACRDSTAGRDWAAVAARLERVYRAVARPRVVVVGHCARPSGAELALLALAPHLAGAVELTVVLGEDGPVAERLRAAGVAVDVLALPPGLAAGGRHGAAAGGLVGLPGYALRLAALLRRRRATVVHAWTLKAGLAAGPAARLAGVPLVQSARDRLAPDYLPGRRAAVVRRATDRLAAAVVANSATTLATWRPVRARGWVVASPGVVREEVDRRRGGPFTVACLSRLSPWKGQDLAVRAFAEAFPAGTARLRLLGDAWFGEDAWREEVVALAASLGVHDRVDLVGHRDDVAEQLADVDVVVACSTVPEPFGQVVVDAMTAGRAVVAAAEGGPAETVTDGVDGLLVPPRDAQALAAALRRLHDDPALRSRLAEQGRASAAGYRPEALAAALLDVYRAVTREAPP